MQRSRGPPDDGPAAARTVRWARGMVVSPDARRPPTHRHPPVTSKPPTVATGRGLHAREETNACPFLMA